MRWVRPIISVMFSIAVIIGFFMGKIEPIPFMLVATGAIGWWFYARDKAKKNGGQ